MRSTYSPRHVRAPKNGGYVHPILSCLVQALHISLFGAPDNLRNAAGSGSQTRFPPTRPWCGVAKPALVRLTDQRAFELRLCPTQYLTAVKFALSGGRVDRILNGAERSPLGLSARYLQQMRQRTAPNWSMRDTTSTCRHCRSAPARARNHRGAITAEPCSGFQRSPQNFRAWLGAGGLILGLKRRA